MYSVHCTVQSYIEHCTTVSCILIHMHTTHIHIWFGGYIYKPIYTCLCERIYIHANL